MALQLMRLMPERFRYALVLAGFVVSVDHPGDAALAAVKPPVFYGRGTADDRIPAPVVAVTEAWLPAHTTPTMRIYEGLGHGISNAELKDVNTFISTHL